VPLFSSFGTILVVYVASGFMRAIVLVANAVGMVQDVPESKVRRGLASGVYNAAGDMGNILGPSIGGFIAHATGIASVFVVGSLGSTALFLIGVLLVRRLASRVQSPESGV
jgi:MFS family permease